jgi:hypothetical protein
MTLLLASTPGTWRDGTSNHTSIREQDLVRKGGKPGSPINTQQGQAAALTEQHPFRSHARGGCLLSVEHSPSQTNIHFCTSVLISVLSLQTA